MAASTSTATALFGESGEGYPDKFWLVAGTASFSSVINAIWLRRKGLSGGALGLLSLNCGRSTEHYRSERRRGGSGDTSIMKAYLILCLVLCINGVTGQRMVTSYGQGLHKDFYSETGRMLQDCSGQSTTWGPGIGPPPDGCGGSGPSDGGSRGGGGTSGQVTSTACAVTSGTCATDGGSSAPGNNDVLCIEQTIPTVTGSTASDIPTLGRAAMTISGGVNIYSAFEAGFNDCAIDGMPCACNEESCDAGLDVGACEAHLHHSCTSHVSVGMFMDTCGGHADPYHIHTDPVCNYETDTATGHSTLLGISMDGSVYHYHVSDYAGYPFTWTLGCYGNPTTPVDLTTCESLYDSYATGADTSTIYTDVNSEGLVVKLWCPCFEVPVFEGSPVTDYIAGVLNATPINDPTCSSDRISFDGSNDTVILDDLEWGGTTNFEVDWVNMYNEGTLSQIG
ncbi:hypothetical protein TrLO_g13316 [Triparma laevis f. longispina]|uniref:Uncharacterized protein n=1 Tax=Triparma laevis f. longispina TaxID=1714387 RepID=A0A9W7FVA6_9STRA|nr:hypothetical protein TrLO_g13316 [Triparma laevis f. longispina]